MSPWWPTSSISSLLTTARSKPCEAARAARLAVMRSRRSCAFSPAGLGGSRLGCCDCCDCLLESAAACLDACSPKQDAAASVLGAAAGAARPRRCCATAPAASCQRGALRGPPPQLPTPPTPTHTQTHTAPPGPAQQLPCPAPGASLPPLAPFTPDLCFLFFCLPLCCWPGSGGRRSRACTGYLRQRSVAWLSVAGGRSSVGQRGPASAASHAPAAGLPQSLGGRHTQQANSWQSMRRAGQALG